MRMAIVATGVAIALSGCVMMEPQVAEDGGAVPPRNTSQAALAALPAGVPPSFLIRDDAGCYGIALEQTEPMSGIPLRDGLGQQVCDA